MRRARLARGGGRDEQKLKVDDAPSPPCGVRRVASPFTGRVTPSVKIIFFLIFSLTFFEHGGQIPTISHFRHKA